MILIQFYTFYLLYFFRTKKKYYINIYMKFKYTKSNKLRKTKNIRKRKMHKSKKE